MIGYSFNNIYLFNIKNLEQNLRKRNNLLLKHKYNR